MKIFIGGTKTIKKLSEFELKYIDDLILKEADILIGDCAGVDKLVQEYLHDKKYLNVTVYSSCEIPRINIGNWDNVFVDSSKKIRGKNIDVDMLEYRDTKLYSRDINPFFNKRYLKHVEKDFMMAKNADSGLMIWDEKSKGTFIDMLALLAYKKQIKLILKNSGEELEINVLEDLKDYQGIEKIYSWHWFDRLSMEEREELLDVFMPSISMKEYLKEQSLSKHQIFNLIAGSPVSIYKKKEWMESLAKKENFIGELLCHVFNRRDRKKQNKSECEYEYEIKDLEDAIDWVLRDSFSDANVCYKEAIRALKSADGDVFLLSEIGYDDEIMDERRHGAEPFKTFDKALAEVKQIYSYQFDSSDLIDGMFPEDFTFEENGFPVKEMTLWYEIEKWESREDDFVLTYTYVLFRDEIIYVDIEDGYDSRLYWGTNNMNLPVPFKAGDIVKIDCTPFKEGTLGVIVEVGDNKDCCCLQALVKQPNDNLVVGAVKHSNLFFDHTPCWMSNLFRIDYFNGKLTPKYKFLQEVKEFIAGDEKKGSYIWENFAYQPASEEKIRETMESYSIN